MKTSDNDKDELAAAEKMLANTIIMARDIVKGEVAKGYVVADQKEIEEIQATVTVPKEDANGNKVFKAGKQVVVPITLEAAMDAALEKAGERRYIELHAMPGAQLLAIKASLPHLKQRVARVEVKASKEGIGVPLAGLGAVTADEVVVGKSGHRLGAAFGIGASFRR